MDETQTNNPQQGTWNSLPTEETEMKPKINFEINVPVTVKFLVDEPLEYPSEISGVYYVFNVLEGNEEKVIMTSAWSLLRALKTRTPLKDKVVEIIKRMEKGRQHFEVKDVGPTVVATVQG